MMTSEEVAFGLLKAIGSALVRIDHNGKTIDIISESPEFNHADQVREGIRKRQEEKFRRYPNYIDDPDYKFCTGCKISKVLDEFGYRKDSSDGRARQCKDCVNKQTKKRRKRRKRNG